ncbi:MAG TPA: alpha/beta fold hydrolase [Burkholderiales bacterium]|nr:alpha/beta fold hydrolase [Burkholderiales bacterium]
MPRPTLPVVALLRPLGALALLGALTLLLPACLATISRAADVEERRAVIMSDGTRMYAEIYYPAGASVPLPAIVMSHGWGGTAAMLRPQAKAFAAAGYFVVAFDYRGWGLSEARVMQAAPAASEKSPDGRFAGEMKEIREVVDPLDQAIDIQNAIHWAMGEPAVDKSRVGLWGTSFSGGLVVYVAARDPRVRALVSQVGYMGQPVATTPAAVLDKSYRDATRRARGELGFPPPGLREIGNLKGAPLREKFLWYAPIDDVAGVRNCAMLFIAAEREELFDNRQHPKLAWERAREPKKYVEIPGIAHYGIYGEAREQATRLAIEWFDEHLKKSQ